VALGNQAENDAVCHLLEWPDGDVAELAPGKRLEPPAQPLLLAVQNSWPRIQDVRAGVVAIAIKAMHNGIPALVGRPVVAVREIVR
jgi:hypothetical protein